MPAITHRSTDPLPSSSHGFIGKKTVLAVCAIALACVAGWGIYRHFAARADSATDPGKGETATRSGRGGPGGPGGPGFDPNRKMPVIVATAQRADVDVFLNGLGTVTAAATVTVKPRIDGQLMRLHFKEGQFVKAGDLLAEIDPRPYQVQLTQAQGQMARDQALLKNARQDLERYRTLVAQDSATQQQLDAQQALVQQYEGTLKGDQGNVDSARLQLIYSRVTAPVSGRLGLRQVDVGNIVHASDANGLVTITQVQPINVVFTLPEKELAPVLKKYNAGETMTAIAYDRSQKSALATGMLATLDNQIDASTGTLKLKAEFANKDASLFPNQFVNIRLKTDTLESAVVVPTAAIQRGSAGTFVYLVKDDQTVSVRMVTPGTVDGERTVIEHGLHGGESLVIDGADKLREGAKVEPVSKEAADKAASAPPAERRRRRGPGAAGSAPADGASRPGAGWQGRRNAGAAAEGVAPAAQASGPRGEAGSRRGGASRPAGSGE